MPSIEIVTHCWSGDKVPIYHRLLQYQLSSILANSVLDFGVKVTVCYSLLDKATIDVLDYFRPRFEVYRCLELRPMALPQTKLFRRAIGRNRAALDSRADAIWFTDCDHIFGEDSLQFAHAHCLASDGNMVHPKQVLINTTHTHGDRLINVPTPMVTTLWHMDKKLFTPRNEKRAWGGLQIVKGDYARQHGYLNGTDWVNPVDASEGFRSCKCDVPYRKSCGGSTAVDIPNVYRIRHTRAGRDGGTVDHGEKLRNAEKTS